MFKSNGGWHHTFSRQVTFCLVLSSDFHFSFIGQFVGISSFNPITPPQFHSQSSHTLLLHTSTLSLQYGSKYSPNAPYPMPVTHTIAFTLSLTALSCVNVIPLWINSCWMRQRGGRTPIWNRLGCSSEILNLTP